MSTSHDAGHPRLRRLLPALAWLPGYSRTDGVADLKAGATVAVLLIPQAMAYAALAGVPPITGLYAAMVSLVVYAAFGTSRFISVGPVAIDSLLTAAAVAPLADGDPSRYVALTGVLTLMVGLLQVAGGLARLGALVNLLSVPVIAGFTSAAALTIAASQLKDFLGLEVEGSSTSFVESVGALLPALSEVDAVTTALGVAALGALLALKRWLPSLPGPLLVVGTAALVVVLGDLQVSQVGQIPSGIPVPAVPDVAWSDLGPLLPSAGAIALISFMESISTGKAFARRTRTSTEPDQELIAVGLSNTFAGVMKGMPVAGGFSRGAVNFNAGARTPMSGVVAAALVVVSLFLLTPVLAYIPKAVLAAIILAAVASLVDVKGALDVWRIRRSDLASLLVTAAATLVLGPSLGLGVGVLVSFVLFLRHLNRPHMPELGYAADKGVFRNVDRHAVTTHPDLLVIRIDAPLSFVGARAISDEIGDQVQRRDAVRFLVIDASAVTDADYTGVEMLGELVDQLEASGVTLHLAALRGPVSDVLGRAAWFRDLCRAGRVHDTVVRAVEALPLDLRDEEPERSRDRDGVSR
jgi:SulP family sulfate permease